MSLERPLRICMVSPAVRSRRGNRVTASRWRAILRRLGHRVEIVHSDDGRAVNASGYDLLVALHARKSFDAIQAFHRRRHGRLLVVTLTGTDLYGDLESSREAWKSLEWADRLIVLQPAGLERFPDALRDKTAVILQSAVASSSPVAKSRRTVDVCVVGHLRPVKDPFRAAEAARLLPEDSKIRVLHAGGALHPEMERRALAETASNPRYRWLGNLPPWKVRRLLKRCHAMVITSHMEGGANVVSEAIVAGTAVLSTRISGSLGMLGDDHPAYFDVGDTQALAALLRRLETDRALRHDLEARSRALAPRFHPDREVEAWKALLDGLSGAGELDGEEPPA
ncbi:MAG: selenoneine biosynthesis selenosugar synthase SenB [Acidobacteriota bacterium]